MIRVQYSGGGRQHTLARLGLHTSPGRFGARNVHDKTGAVLFAGIASDVWAWLRNTGRIVTVGDEVDAALAVCRGIAYAGGAQ